MEKERNIGDPVEQSKTEQGDISEKRGEIFNDLSIEIKELLGNAVLESKTKAFRDYITSNPGILGKDEVGVEEMSDFEIRQIMEEKPELLREAVSQDSECAKMMRLAAAIETLMNDPEVIEKLEEKARTDSLTGLLNRRALEEELEIEIERSRREDNSLLIIYLDMDDLKKINDEQGHHKGDEALISLSEIMKENCRATDRIARVGGDEFIILLNGKDNEKALSRLRSQISNASIGHCFYKEKMSTKEAIIIAEEEMKKEKERRKKGR